MTESNNKVERLQQKPIETVRIIVVDAEGNILLLKKSEKSIAKGLYEFPGGKIDEIAGESSTLSEQQKAAKKELSEEAGVDSEEAVLNRVGDFTYEFGNKSEYNNSRKVHVFVAKLETSKPELVVGQTKNALGESEDFHDNYIWVTKTELDQLKYENKLLGNSTNYQDFI